MLWNNKKYHTFKVRFPIMWYEVVSSEDMLARKDFKDLEALTTKTGVVFHQKFLKPLMGGFRFLKFLDLSKLARLDDNEMRYLVNLQSLEYLDVSNSQVTQRSFVYLLKHSRMKETLKALKLVILTCMSPCKAPF
jgi:hypothetical protein